MQPAWDWVLDGRPDIIKGPVMIQTENGSVALEVISPEASFNELWNEFQRNRQYYRDTYPLLTENHILKARDWSYQFYVDNYERTSGPKDRVRLAGFTRQLQNMKYYQHQYTSCVVQ